MLDLDIQAFVDASDRFYPPGSAGLPVADQRRLYDAYARTFTPPRPDGVAVVDGVLQREGPPIPLRLFRPDKGPCEGLALYFHGGGFVLGSLDSHDGLTARLARDAGTAVVAVDYRLAPEHVYPAQRDDALAVIAAALAGQLPFAGLPSGRPVLVGDSAGGTIAASAAVALGPQRGRLAGLALVYPALGRVPEEPAATVCSAAPMLSTADVLAYVAAYLGGGTGADGAFPLEAEDLAGFPPTLLQPVEHDPLRDDSQVFARRLAEAGVPVQLDLGRGLVHGSLRAIDLSTEARRQWTLLAGFVAERARAGLHSPG